MGSRSVPNFCSQCGASLSPGDAFCSQCGKDVGGDAGSVGSGRDGSGRGSGGRGGGRGGGPSGGGVGGGRVGSGAPDPTRSTDFQRRIEDLAAEGWEVEHDYGDRVVMVDRGFGSWGVHALLLVFTGGLGNIPYAWYCYSTQSDRIELRADGTDRHVSGGEGESGDADASEVTGGSVVLSFLAALVGLTVFSGGVSSLLAFFVGVTSLLFALYALPPVRERLHDRESVDTFGPVRSTEEEVVDAPDTPCTACSRPVDTGVKRTFNETFYLAGVPLTREEKGQNHYCRSCAQGDPFTESDVETDDREAEWEF